MTFDGGFKRLPTLRAADKDREEATLRLQRHYEEGRLDYTEFQGRLHQALAAKTYLELDQLFLDLPPLPPLVEWTPVAPSPPILRSEVGFLRSGSDWKPIGQYLVASGVVVATCMAIWLDTGTGFLWVGIVIALLILGLLPRLIDRANKRGRLR